MVEGDAILRRFADILMNDIGGAGRAARGSPGAGGLFPSEDRASPSGARIQRTTFQTGPFGSVTFTSGTIGSGPEGAPLTMGTYVIPLRGNNRPGRPRTHAIVIARNSATNSGEPPRLFDQLFGNPWGQGPGLPDPNRRDRGGGAPAPFGGGLAELLNSLYNPAAAVHGDAVFSQEALDRIVTQLMEASPQTNAAPPASQSAIDNLERKRVDKEILGPEGKAECTICIDELKEGDEVLVLPCKHWYHGECVILWLKEHNTCPVCRTPIENRQGAGSSSNNPNPDNHNNSNNPREFPGPSTSTPGPGPGPGPGAFPGGPGPTFTTSTSTYGPFTFTSLTARPRPERERPTMRSPRENADRLNAIRNVAGSGSPSNPYRRNSHSPPSHWLSPSHEEAAARARVRSQSRERERERERDPTGTGWDWPEFYGGGGRIGGTPVATGMPGGGWDRAEYAPGGIGGIGGMGSAGRRPSGREGSQPQSPTQQSSQQHQNQQSQQQQQQQGQGGARDGGTGGAFSWLRDHFGSRRGQ
jgi:hypothetical protein